MFHNSVELFWKVTYNDFHDKAHLPSGSLEAMENAIPNLQRLQAKVEALSTRRDLLQLDKDKLAGQLKKASDRELKAQKLLLGD